MHDIASLNWPGILVAALSGFVIGSLWYGPLFQKPWMQLTGMTKEKGAQASMPLTFGGAYVLNVLGATGIAILLGGHSGWGAGLHTGAFTAFFFIATALGPGRASFATAVRRPDLRGWNAGFPTCGSSLPAPISAKLGAEPIGGKP